MYPFKSHRIRKLDTLQQFFTVLSQAKYKVLIMNINNIFSTLLTQKILRNMHQRETIDRTCTQ